MMLNSRHKIIGLALIFLLLYAQPRIVRAQKLERPAPADRLLVGLYTFVGERLTSDAVDEMPDELPAFLKFCGYNTIEFADWSFEYPRDKTGGYFAASAARVTKARRAGLKVYVLLLTNMSRGRAILNHIEPDPSKKGSLLFDPLGEPQEYAQRMRDVEEAVGSAFAAADGFEVFAGDWGGCLGEGCGHEQYLRFARDYAQVIRKSNARAEIVLNTWAIANWGSTFDVTGVKFWDEEIRLSQNIMRGDIVFADAVTLPGHHWYRFLVRQIYHAAGRAVPDWPDAAAVGAAKKFGKKVYLWPHFVVDDDRGRKMTSRKVHFEVRYIKDLAARARAAGIDGAFANAYAPALQMGNVFAFGRLLRRPNLDVQAVLKEFSALLVAPESVGDMEEILAFLENRSWWANQMPKPYRLAELPCRIRTYDEALAALARVKPLSRSPAPLLIGPGAYLGEMRSTLLFMKQNYPD